MTAGTLSVLSLIHISTYLESHSKLSIDTTDRLQYVMELSIIQEGGTLVGGSSRNNYRLPASHQLNIGFNLHKQTRHGERIWNISILNAYNAKMCIRDSVNTESVPAVMPFMRIKNLFYFKTIVCILCLYIGLF